MINIRGTIILSIKKILDNKFTNIIIIMQIFVALLTVNILVGRVQYTYYLKNIIENGSISKAVYFSPSPQFVIGAMNNNQTISTDEKVNSISNIDQIGKIYTTRLIMPQIDAAIEAYVYNNSIINSIKLPLYKGKWFPNEQIKDDRIPIILSYSMAKFFKVGDLLPIKYVDKNNNTGEMYAQVIGIMNNSNFFLRLGAGGSKMQLNQIFSRNQFFAIIPYTNINTRMQTFDQFGRILFINNDANRNEAIEKAKNILMNLGHTDTIENMISNYLQSNHKNIIMQSVLSILLLMLAISGVGGSNALLLINQEKEFAIYFMCGLSWGRCILIIIIRSSVLLILPLILSSIATNALYWTLFGENMIINVYNIGISVAFVIFIYFISSLSQLIAFYKTSPISIIRRWI